LLASCKEKKGETGKLPPAVTESIRKEEEIKKDSLAKATSLKKKIYLTFDDGPNKGSMNVLKVVKEEKVPASFFIVGRNVFETPEQQETWKEFKAYAPIEIYNHSYSHALNKYKKYYTQPGQIIKDFEKNQEILGFQNTVVRMPGRNAWRIDTINHTDILNCKAAIDSVHKAGYDVIGWDLEWLINYKTAAPAIDADLLLRQIKNKFETETTRTPGHLVVLMHDQSFGNEKYLNQLRYFIQQLKNNPAYELVLVSSYPGLKKRPS